jgi:hypothetical protein
MSRRLTIWCDLSSSNWKLLRFRAAEYWNVSVRVRARVLMRVLVYVNECVILLRLWLKSLVSYSSAYFSPARGKNILSAWMPQGNVSMEVLTKKFLVNCGSQNSVIFRVVCADTLFSHIITVAVNAIYVNIVLLLFDLNHAYLFTFPTIHVWSFNIPHRKETLWLTFASICKNVSRCLWRFMYVCV